MLVLFSVMFVWIHVYIYHFLCSLFLSASRPSIFLPSRNMSLISSFNENLLAINSLFFFVWQCLDFAVVLEIQLHGVYGCESADTFSEYMECIICYLKFPCLLTFFSSLRDCYSFEGSLFLPRFSYNCFLSYSVCSVVVPQNMGVDWNVCSPPQDSLYILRVEVHIVIGSGKCSATPPSRTVSPPGHPSTCGVLSTCLKPQ